MAVTLLVVAPLTTSEASLSRNASVLPTLLDSYEVSSILGVDVRSLRRAQHPDTPGSERYPQASCRVGRSFRWDHNEVVRFMTAGNQG